MLFTCAMITISCVYTIVIILNQTTINERLISSLVFLTDIVEKFESTGSMSAVGRASSVMIGLYTGHLLRMYEVGEIRDWPRWFRRRISLAVVLLLNPLVLSLPLARYKPSELSGHAANLNEFVASYVISIPLYSITLTALILLAVTTYSRTALARFLGHSFWHSANKLGFCIYLAHWSVLLCTMFGYDYGLGPIHCMDIAKTGAFVLLVSTLLSFLLYILYEAPMLHCCT
jgi:hypothetical protein